MINLKNLKLKVKMKLDYWQKKEMMECLKF